MPDADTNTPANTRSAGRPPTPTAPELAERGAGGQSSDTRLYFQLLVFTDCRNSAAAADHVKQHAQTPAVVYESLNDPRGVALLTFSADPGDLLSHTRPLVLGEPWADYTPLPEFTMLGRSYSIGYEHDLADVLVGRPTRHALNPDTPWAVWYPLRRKGSFEQLPREEQNAILKQHGTIGFSFGHHGHAADIRLACHGLDVRDNDFVIGLMGQELTPLSKLVQAMRKTDQTSMYLEQLGPFFVGRALYQSPMP
ncbi:MAG: chlorite dismutase family protein [Planctomycetota bacterium]